MKPTRPDLLILAAAGLSDVDLAALSVAPERRRSHHGETMLKLHIVTPGSSDYRTWLRDAVVDASMTAARAEEIEIERGPELKVTCSGGSSSEEDDADHEAADRVAAVIRSIADGYEPEPPTFDELLGRAP